MKENQLKNAINTAVINPENQGYKLKVSCEDDFNKIMSLAESIGYYNGLSWEGMLTKTQTLQLNHDTKHIQWSHRPIESYADESEYIQISIEQLEGIAFLLAGFNDAIQVVCPDILEDIHAAFYSGAKWAWLNKANKEHLVNPVDKRNNFESNQNSD